MTGAFEWISWIAQWLGQFVPRWVILDVREKAIKFVNGSKVKVLEPGIHWYWPATTTFITYPVVRQPVNLKSQTFTTTDNKTIMVGGMLVYEVFDIEALITKAYHPDSVVSEISLTAVHDVCCQMSWVELHQAQRNGKLDTALRQSCAAALKPYGVKVVKAMLTDLAPTRVFKLVQATSTD